MLGLYEFNQLPEADKYAYVWEHCILLANYVEDEIFTAGLYHAPGPFRMSFFIELWYNVSDNKLDGINTFRSTRRLSHYLDEIDIHSIL